MKKFDYDLIVLGGGAAGFVSAKMAQGLGKKVALIEKNRLGGDCTWFGCIPSKTLIKVSTIAHQIKNTGKFGLLQNTDISLDTDHVMEHVRSVVKRVYDGHTPETFTKIGIDIFFGEAQFIDNHRIALGDKILSAKKYMISTGSSPFIPDIQGLDAVPYHTNRTIFDIEKLPASMIVLGGGPIGTELAMAFHRLGVRVHILETADRILIREDRELADMLSQNIQGEGITLLTKIKPLRYFCENGRVVLAYQDEKNRPGTIDADAVLIAIGRKPNVQGLNLEKAGVEYSAQGIKTNERLQTTASNIYSCGDVVGPYRFSHMAEYQAVIATRNALLPFQKKVDYRHVAWCTFTDPELAHAGLTEQEAREKLGDRIRIYRHEYKNTDRGRTDGIETGISKFICDSRGTLIGAHILGKHAGDLIHEAQLTKSLGIPFYKIYSAVHIYPTLSDIVRQPAKLCYIDRLQSNIFLRILRNIMGKRR
ncbi:MAG: FAD-dependent oxidoreductase [Thermodesulfovibrionales bacterium]|nr:FAD-dependent oxidoreductase [Thermodesulfovibrionales bacterium]